MIMIISYNTGRIARARSAVINGKRLTKYRSGGATTLKRYNVCACIIHVPNWNFDYYRYLLLISLARVDKKHKKKNTRTTVYRDTPLAGEVIDLTLSLGLRIRLCATRRSSSRGPAVTRRTVVRRRPINNYYSSLQQSTAMNNNDTMQRASTTGRKQINRK